MLLKVISILLLSLISSWCLGQSNNSPNIDLNQQNIGKSLFKKSKGGDLKSTYLGKISDTSGKVRFYVVTEFMRFRADIVYHGQSKLIFYNSSKKVNAQYYFDMPEELPFKLESNTLYFHDSNEKLSLLTLQIGEQLPKHIFNSY